MSQSNLVTYTRISPNSTNPRNHKIDTITIHHMAGNLSAERCGEIFADPNRQASSNYGIGSDGRVALYVEEENRSWCTGSRENDHRAITIEVANDGGEPDWHVSDKALASLIDLCEDICRRNSIKKLNFTGDKTGNMTMHKWFQATGCPGPYLSGKFPYIAEEVNKRLNPEQMYRVRTSWEDAASQIGAYQVLENAVSACPKGYKVYDKDGYCVFDHDEEIGALERFIREVQKVCGAAVDGIAGPETLFKTVTLSAYKNHRHAAVKSVQEYLYVLGYTEVGEADGIAGAKFTNAVKRYQEDKGCIVDGEITAGALTWQKLLGLK